MASSAGPRVHTIDADAPFLPTLAARLVEGSLIPGFPAPADPLALARATIYVPTRRAAQALGRAIAEASGQAAVALPDIRALGDFESAEGALLPDESDGAPPAAVGELERRVALATMIRAWSRALKSAVVEEDGGPGAAALVAATPAQAFALAGQLGELIDEMTIEGVDWGRLDALVPDAFDRYWSLTLTFLKIAAEAWPARLAELRRVDRVERGARLIEAEIARLSAPSAGPAIVAGSTGTNRATAALMRAVARLPAGAVVLPGLDRNLDDASAGQILSEDAAAASAGGHPQAALLRLLAAMDVRRDQVRPLTGAGVGAPASRMRLLSEAMRPSETTDLWGRPDAPGLAAAPEALADVALVVAENETEEALAIAIALRRALEIPGKRAALITPSAAISRRVAADLARFGVEVEDAAGSTLARAPASGFARLALRAAIDRSPGAYAALVAHRLFRAPGGVDLAAARRALDLGVLRRPEATIADALAPGGVAAARAALGQGRPHPATAGLGDADWRAAEAVADFLRGSFAELRDAPFDAPLKTRLRAHRALVERLCGATDGATVEGFDAVFALFDAWIEAAGEQFAFALPDYAALFDEALERQRWSAGVKAHPRIALLGLLEARLMDFDCVVLAGLDETVWPPAAAADAFLNRVMRAALGLSSPERRIGQTAHDFVGALGAREAILTRARKRDRQPTLESRFLLRLRAVAADAVEDAGRRGDAYLGWARALDRPPETTVIRPPTPRPPRALRPTRLSVTRVEALRRDPYAVFASEILELRPLDAIGVSPGPREIGVAWHAALQAHGEAGDFGASGRDALLSRLRAALAPYELPDVFEALRWPGIVRAVDAFLAVDALWRADARRVLLERSGALTFDTPGGVPFTLSARADRIDLLEDGSARLIDFKTGAPPSGESVRLGLSPQMTLEAAMVLGGGFKDLPAVKRAVARYVKIGGQAGCKESDAVGAKHDLDALAAQHLEALKRLVDAYASEATPYLSRLHPVAGRSGDFDALARVGEWSATGALAEGEEGGE